MSIIERTEQLNLAQFKGSSINPAILEYYTEDMKKIDDTFVALSDKVDACETLVNSYETRVSTLESRADGTDATLLNYESRLVEIERVIDTVSTANIDDLTERVNALENKVETNTLAINGLTGRVDNLEDTLQEIRNSIASNHADIVALDRRIERLEECCSEVQTKLLEIDTTLLEHAGLINGLRTDVNKNKDNIQANAQDITILATQISVLNTNVNALVNDMDVQHIVEFASVNTQSFTAKGLTFNLVSEGGWCHCVITGTTNVAITNNDTWDEVIPEGFIPAVDVVSSPVVPSSIANQLINFTLGDDGNITNSAMQTIASGTIINHVIDYPLSQPSD